LKLFQYISNEWFYAEGGRLDGFTQTAPATRPTPDEW